MLCEASIIPPTDRPVGTGSAVSSTSTRALEECPKRPRLGPKQVLAAASHTCHDAINSGFPLGDLKHMSETRAVLLGCGVARGRHAVDNDRLARVMDTDDQWIRERTGIEQRYFVDAGVASSDLGIEASKNAVLDAGIEPSEIDYVVCATMTPDHYFPGSGTIIQHGLGIDPRPALDIRQQCAGFAYGLQMVDALIRSGIAKTVLLVGSDVHTSLMPLSKQAWEILHAEEAGEKVSEEEYQFISSFRHLLVLFGDAAGAMIFRADETSTERGILGSELYGDGENWDTLHVPGLGSRSRPIVDHEMIDDGRWVPVMDGRKTFKLAVTRMPRVVLSLLEKHGYALEDVSLLVMHQANLRINEAAQKALGLPDERVHNVIQQYGNTTSATLPLTFHDARAAGKAEKGSLVAFTALGAGLHWGAVLLRV